MSKIATDENVLYVRRYDAMCFIEHATSNEQIEHARSNEQIMARDDFHLNDLGYRCMAEHIARAVVVNLFVNHTQAPAE